MELSEDLFHFEFAEVLKTNTGCILLSDLKRKAGLQLEKFSSLALGQLAEQYIDIPPAISLVNCPNCDITLASSHPYNEKIIDWLVGNFSVQEAFKEVEFMYELIQSIENKEMFIKHNSKCFHVGFTSLGTIAYFDGCNCYTAL